MLQNLDEIDEYNEIKEGGNLVKGVQLKPIIYKATKMSDSGQEEEKLISKPKETQPLFLRVDKVLK